MCVKEATRDIYINSNPIKFNQGNRLIGKREKNLSRKILHEITEFHTVMFKEVKRRTNRGVVQTFP